MLEALAAYDKVINEVLEESPVLSLEKYLKDHTIITTGELTQLIIKLNKCWKKYKKYSVDIGIIIIDKESDGNEIIFNHDFIPEIRNIIQEHCKKSYIFYINAKCEIIEIKGNEDPLTIEKSVAISKELQKIFLHLGVSGIDVLINGVANIGIATASDIFPVTVTNNVPSTFPLGVTDIIWTATDTNGNTCIANQKVFVKYDFIGVKQLFNLEESSSHEVGSTIPVKFQLKDANGEYISNALVSLGCVLLDEEDGETGTDTVSKNATKGDYNFRYDASDKQYIYNLRTKGMQTGLYLLTIYLNDGCSYSTKIILK
jgi:hypothetical protein